MAYLSDEDRAEYKKVLDDFVSLERDANPEVHDDKLSEAIYNFAEDNLNPWDKENTDRYLVDRGLPVSNQPL